MSSTSAVVGKYSVVHSLGVPLGVLNNTNIWKSNYQVTDI